MSLKSFKFAIYKWSIGRRTSNRTFLIRTLELCEHILMQTLLFSYLIKRCCLREFHCSSVLRVKDYYHILGVSKDATSNQIRSAYLTLCKQFHPDAHPEKPTSTIRFQEINEAYSILSDTEKRRDYDHTQQNPFNSRRTVHNEYGSYYRPNVQYHRPYESKENDDYYKNAYRSEYDRYTKHEADVKSGKIKPIRARIVFGHWWDPNLRS
ncbi:protein tumorous imaginal discs-like isoform X2 [Leptotrombidium deliense]|uniref:Protein tumorous imaginal discs-like isoform X2 n=1 Tax=Leptotrombidium deliense TaxID=299467 RepID=A0A443S0I9_9ACAR|nr:protein tumorous imaginal discs-like isoform X2 [Leptotrombidium deliense]